MANMSPKYNAERLKKENNRGDYKLEASPVADQRVSTKFILLLHVFPCPSLNRWVHLSRVAMLDYFSSCFFCIRAFSEPWSTLLVLHAVNWHLAPCNCARFCKFRTDYSYYQTVYDMHKWIWFAQETAISEPCWSQKTFPRHLDIRRQIFYIAGYWKHSSKETKDIVHTPLLSNYSTTQIVYCTIFLSQLGPYLCNQFCCFLSRLHGTKF